ncbi:MAG: cell division protein FtsQ/DivIB [Tangfeifania sp.]
MLRKLLKLTGFILLVAFLVITLAFSASESRNIPCRSIEIEISEDELIKISKEEITRLVNSADEHLIGKDLEQINADFIEAEVEKHQAIFNAEIYKVIVKDTVNYRGILGVRVKHREPAVRIMSAEGRYYLDENGEKIPVSANYTANVLVATGYFSEKFAKDELLPFVLFLDNNPFWKAQIEQVHVEQDGDIILTPLIGDHLIELGTLENFPQKLQNMKAFYQQVMARNKWNEYKMVSLKYDNQVIAKKR